MKLVHKSLIPSIVAAYGCVLAVITPASAAPTIPKGEQPPYLEAYNPEAGFTSKQLSLAKIFRQLAGSLEHYGTPEPYIRHVIAVHKRAGGKDRPSYLTDEYIEVQIGNWNRLSQNLRLDDFARKAGRNMRLAIRGTWNMPVWEAVARETALSPREAATFRKFLEKPYFKKADFKELEAFYADGGGYDKLSESGKSAISLRLKRGQMTPSQRDASIREKADGGTMAVELLNTYQGKLTAYLSGAGKNAADTDYLIEMLKEKLMLDQSLTNFSGMPDYTHDAIYYSHLIRAEFSAISNHIRRTETKENAEALIPWGLIPRRLRRLLERKGERIHPQKSQRHGVAVPLGVSSEVPKSGF